MDLKAGLWQKQTLKLAMTQELSQAIALLQYSAQELAAFLEAKSMENPLIQVDYKNIKNFDTNMDRTKKTQKRTFERDQKNLIEQIGSNESETLEDHLLSQLNLLTVTPNEKQILHALIESIDENGYLDNGRVDVARRFNLTDEMVESAISKLHGLDPAGIAARNLQECLILQLERTRTTPEIDLSIKIISEHFLLFAEKKWKALAKIMDIDIKDIQKVFDYVQQLNPKPGAAFQREKPAYIVPDVVVRREGDELSVSVFDALIPKISFNEGYYRELSGHKDPDVNKFLQEKQGDYQWIQRSLMQRKETLLKVSMKIIEKQPDFFMKGPAHLNPMTMREVAEELDIHESTVSRTVREKYMQTPAGTYELKSFFTSALQTTENDQASSQKVKAAIELFIKEENKQKPISDQDIVEMLKNREGMVVSRRTVAKYRDQLGIPSSSKRKRFDE
ncbi:RNA polymerase factor sigma-54 [Mesobacillus subterraneus]|uniref:RNA polymerase factor sigma-54 n=1 Tax=Mesobacillus subterraneus TaxID=285983 RepID=UPI00203E8F3D|nr:RNA polymerase factor sigma-54 [Mesobacillus subterraneus]MCM3663430.1 RNA polymerase factor sigma-54 [Mesobacillus subterraneus]MCM3683201.1 RNA polymerase factor sigma-54 [Mesobacillus subterraneus]